MLTVIHSPSSVWFDFCEPLARLGCLALDTLTGLAGLLGSAFLWSLEVLFLAAAGDLLASFLAGLVGVAFFADDDLTVLLGVEARLLGDDCLLADAFLDLSLPVEEDLLRKM